jgi:pSer/pThr/pTyr-binding forkhead associated (FHA) protein/tetratricopeptide (TPR) repeat protein
MHKLVIQDDEGKTTVVPLIRDEITVGRKEGNTIRLTERNVSRRHARILRKNGSVAIEDLNSYNGVRVNGSRIQGRVGLSVSDRVQIGDYLIELKADTGVVGVESYGDETQPMDTADLDLRSSSPSLPAIPQIAMQDAEAATTKVPMAPMAPMMPGASMPPPPVPPPISAEHIAPGGLPQQIQEASPARLVILSTNFAGRDLELNKPAMVIGRTDDNDLVVNHRSISRHHAKIVRENGRYAIVDLQSSNGVRVNGEEYSKVELRRGDLIDLGHVRLRFVEPGEDFLFGRDAQAVSLATGGGRGLIYAGAAVLLVGMIAVFALTRGGGEGENKSPDEDPVAQADEDQAGTKATQEVPNQQKSVVAEPDLEKIKPFIDKARSAIDAEKWDEAVAAANQALAVQPQNEEAKQLASNAQNQKENENRFNVFKQAAKKKDYPQVASSFEAIDSDSIYKNRARDDHDRLQALYKDGMLKRARLLAKKNKCSEVDALAAEARNVWSAVGDAVASVECRKPVAVANNTSNTSNTSKKPPVETVVQPTNNDSAGDSGEGSDDEDGSSSSKPSKSYEQLMTESRAAYMSGQYGKARRLCNDALKLKPRDQEAATLCGFAACNMKNAKLAKRYQSMLPETRKSSVRQTCLKAGIRDFE